MDQKKYADYSVADFMKDDDFLRWATQPNQEDKVFWAAFLMDYPGQKENVNKASKLLQELRQAPLPTGLSMAEKESMLADMQARIRKQRPAPGSQKARRRQLIAWQPLAIAASVLLLIMAGWWLLNSPATQTITTAYGQRQSITLPDGSEVELNANSTLKFETDWTDAKDRRVWLNGEAFFKVEKKWQTGQKFQVITGDLTVEVLGTVFNVNSRHEETEVFLEEGSIRLELAGLQEELMLEPGETVAYSRKSSQLPEKKQVQAQLHTSWTDGLLFYNNTPLREVLEEVADLYGVSFHLTDTTNYSRAMNTAVPIGNLEEAITVIGTTLNLDFQPGDTGYIVGSPEEK